MNESDVVAAIRHHCTAPDSFLVNLRFGHFLEDDFLGLTAALTSYRDRVGGQDYVSREVVYCLYFLNATLLGACLQADATTASGERILRARMECSKLIAAILTPDALASEPGT